jgi:hypothetical protein
MRYDELHNVLDIIIENEIEQATDNMCQDCNYCESIGCENVYCPILAENPDVRSCEIQADVDRMITEWNTLLDAVEGVYGTDGRTRVLARFQTIIQHLKEEPED